MENQTEAQRHFEAGNAFYEKKKYTEACNEYKQAIEKNPKFPDAYNNWGLALAGLKRYEEAVEKYQTATEVDPQYANAYNSWGVAFASLKQYEEAIEKYQKAIDVNPQCADAYNNWGNALANLKRYEESVEKYRKATKVNPQYALAYNNWGLALAGLKRYEEASEKFQKAIEFGPNAVNYTRWVETLNKLESDKKSKAIEKAQETMDSKSEYADAYNNWGNVFFDLKRYEEAIEKYRKATEVDRQYVYAHNNWGLALVGLNRQAEAIEKYRQITTDINQQYPDAYNNWGLALADLKLYEEASEKFQKAIEFGPDVVNYTRWVETLNKLEPDKKSKAVEKARETLDSKPECAGAYYNWGYALAYLKRDDEAIEKYQKATEIKPKYPDAYIGWGNVFFDLKRYEEAIERYQRAIEANPQEVNPQYVYAYNNWGLVLYKQEKYERAIEKFEKTVESDFNYAAAHHNVAYILWRQGKYKKAREKWKKAREAYKATKENARDAKDAGHFAVYGMVLLEVFAEFKTAEEVFREGLEIEPTHTGILTNLVSLYNAGERDAEDRRDLEEYDECTEEMMTYHSKAWDAYRTAEQVLADKLRKGEDASTHLQAGELYLSMDEYDKAEEHLLKALSAGCEELSAFAKLGIVCTRKEDFSKAIQYLKDACKRDPQDLTIRSSLAEAYLKSGKLESAEKEYIEVLRTAPYHVESEIGLGEVYKELGEEGKDREFYCQEAVSHFSNALKKSESDHRSKKLTRKELASVYYSRGYARVSLYEASKSSRDEDLLKGALSDFKQCQKRDPFHQKAKRAIEKILDMPERSLSRRIMERIGPPVIFAVSLIIFIMSQVSFYIGKPTWDTNSVMITDKSMVKLLSRVNAEEAQKALEAMQGQVSIPLDKFLDTFVPEIGKERFDKLKQTIIKCAQRSNKLRWVQPIDLGYYVLLTFGSLIFMITGFYLPHLSKMKFGTIEMELEKGPGAQITPSGGLNISK